VTPKDKYEIGAGGSFIANEDEVQIVNLELFGRIGLGKNFDTGVKVFGLPGLYGSFMTDLKYQIIDDPIYISADLGGSYCYSHIVNYYDVYPMLIAGTENIYGGYRRIYRYGNADDSKIEFSGYMQSFFIGFKTGPGPYLRPEIAYYFNNSKTGFLVFGLGLQFK
jgi:hypothetical protein